jgi:hypothetical protein
MVVADGDERAVQHRPTLAIFGQFKLGTSSTELKHT